MFLYFGTMGLRYLWYNLATRLTIKTYITITMAAAQTCQEAITLNSIFFTSLLIILYKKGYTMAAKQSSVIEALLILVYDESYGGEALYRSGFN